LDLIFQWGHQCVDLEDALKAYSERPLERPPPAYLNLFHQVDWSRDRPSEQARAIILAGSDREEDKLLLLRILNNLGEDFRDGALYAASTFSERRFIETVSKIAMSVTEPSSFATGEIWAFVTCYKRWLGHETISIEALHHLLETLENPQPHLMRARRLINHVTCPNWDRIPFPNERTTQISDLHERK
jgi:hypothetical protein